MENPFIRLQMALGEEALQKLRNRHVAVIGIGGVGSYTAAALARVMRKELRNRGVNHHTVLFSPEEPLTPASLEAPPPGRRSIPASVSWVPSVAGLMIAGHIVLDLTGRN